MLETHKFGSCPVWSMTPKFCMADCVVCGTPLTGRKTRFCARSCKNSFGNNRLQSYRAQQLRGRERKIRLVRSRGSCCESCGYAKNFAALEFHHLDPLDKAFNLDLRSLSNRRWSSIVAEEKKCALLCSNCHKELHNPECDLGTIQYRP